MYVLSAAFVNSWDPPSSLSFCRDFSVMLSTWAGVPQHRAAMPNVVYFLQVWISQSRVWSKAWEYDVLHSWNFWWNKKIKEGEFSNGSAYASMFWVCIHLGSWSGALFLPLYPLGCACTSSLPHPVREVWKIMKSSGCHPVIFFPNFGVFYCGEQSAFAS